MSDRATFVVALATALGAWLLAPIPRGIAYVLVVCVVVARAPLVLALTTCAWASASGAVALAALRTPPPSGQFEGTITLVGDPVPLSFGARVDVRIDGRRYEAQVDRTLARELVRHLAGERVTVKGRFGARPHDAPWLDARHIAGRFRIEELNQWRPASPAYAGANALRRTLDRGARPLPAAHRSLYTGLVYGDDRAQGALLADDFRAGGMGHLLAVSGQNVAFVLAAAGPLLRRVSFRVRWPVTLGVLAVFVLTTRAEPSVLRAAAMAAIAARAAATGRTASGLRIVALAVTALLCIDPLLMRALGFQLSVAASLGILVFSAPITARLRGPDALREAFGVTIAAQLAVAPLSVLAFGGVPLASVPANMLALPAAGPIMVWGLTGGFVAGVVGGPIGSLLQLPTRALVWWIATVAAHAGRSSLGTLRARHVLALCVAVALGVVAHRSAASYRRHLTRAGWIVALVAVAAPLLVARSPAPVEGRVATGVWLWRRSAVVVEIDATARAADTLAALRDHDVGAVDVLVVRTPASAAATVARDLRARYDPPVLWAPPTHQIRGASTPVPGASVVVGSLVVTVLEVGASIRVDVRAV